MKILISSLSTLITEGSRVWRADWLVEMNRLRDILSHRTVKNEKIMDRNIDTIRRTLSVRLVCIYSTLTIVAIGSVSHRSVSRSSFFVLTLDCFPVVSRSPNFFAVKRMDVSVEIRNKKSVIGRVRGECVHVTDSPRGIPKC